MAYHENPKLHFVFRSRSRLEQEMVGGASMALTIYEYIRTFVPFNRALKLAVSAYPHPRTASYVPVTIPLTRPLVPL